MLYNPCYELMVHSLFDQRQTLNHQTTRWMQNVCTFIAFRTKTEELSTLFSDLVHLTASFWLYIHDDKQKSLLHNIIKSSFMEAVNICNN